LKNPMTSSRTTKFSEEISASIFSVQDTINYFISIRNILLQLIRATSSEYINSVSLNLLIYSVAVSIHEHEKMRKFYFFSLGLKISYILCSLQNAI
jgi:hypothetical protein